MKIKRTNKDYDALAQEYSYKDIVPETNRTLEEIEKDIQEEQERLAHISSWNEI